MNSPGRNARVSLPRGGGERRRRRRSRRRAARPERLSRAEQVAPKNPGAQTHAPVSASHAPRPGPPPPADPGHAAATGAGGDGVSQRPRPRRGRCTRRRTTSRVGPEAPSARRRPLRPAGARPASSHRRRRLPSPSPAKNSASARRGTVVRVARVERRSSAPVELGGGGVGVGGAEPGLARARPATAGPPSDEDGDADARARSLLGFAASIRVVRGRRRRRRRIRPDDASSRVKKSTGRERDERLGVVRVRAPARRARRRAAKHGERISPEEHARARRVVRWLGQRHVQGPRARRNVNAVVREVPLLRGAGDHRPERERLGVHAAARAEEAGEAVAGGRAVGEARASGHAALRAVAEARRRLRGGYGGAYRVCHGLRKARALVPRQRPVDPARLRRRAAVVHAHVRRLVRVGKEGEEHLVVVLHRAVHAVAKRAGRVAVVEPRPDALVVQNLELAFPRRVRRRRPARARLARRGARGRRRRRRRRRTPRTAPR